MIHATVIGNIGNEPTLATGGNGTSYIKLRVAASFKDREGEKTTWVGGTLFNKRAEALAPHLKKGDKVALRGTLYTREHEGKTYVDMNVDEIELLGGKRESTGDTAPRVGNGAGRGAVKASDFGDDEALPF